MLPELSIWIRDTKHPCLPYQSTGHSWYAAIFTCDLQPLTFGKVNGGLVPLDVPGAARGKIHGQVKVPPGCYIVFGVATCKNVFTDFAYVQARCEGVTCVNLLTRRMTTCAGQLIFALKVAQNIGGGYAFNCAAEADKAPPPEVLERAIGALEELQKHMPPDPVGEAMPVSPEQVVEMVGREESE